MDAEDTRVIWQASSPLFRRGYHDLGLLVGEQFDGRFAIDLRAALNYAQDNGETVTFFCDDDIVFRPVPYPPSEAVRDGRVICHNMSLGQDNAKMPIPSGFPTWDWTKLPPHDFGFPCGVNGVTYRPDTFLEMLGQRDPPDPTWMETLISMRLDNLKQWPLMASYDDQCVVSVAVNRTTVSEGAPAGRKFPQSAKALASRFIRGQRIDLDAIDFGAVDSVHHEFRFAWR